jgi:cutinase-like protein
VNVIELAKANGVYGLIAGVSVRRSVRLLGAAVVAWAALVCAPLPNAIGQPCPDIEVVFARGTNEPPGLGWVGQAFVDSLRAQAGPRSVGVYPVNYAASGDFGSPDFPRTVVDGISDAIFRVQFMSTDCPNTRMVLAGYSQGAVVAEFVPAQAIPNGVADSSEPTPLPPEAANHVAAVALFGKPNGQFLQKYGAPPVVVGPSYTDRIIELCALGDPVCGDGGNDTAHGSYVVNGQVNEGAAFAASRL